MLFDPEDGMTLEQSIEIAWHRLLSPDMRARVLALAQATGRTRNEVILECQRRFLEDLEDPARRQAYDAKLDWERQPFGKDPWLEQRDS